MPPRVLLVGRVTDPAGRRTGFPELRTTSFQAALAAAGLQVRLCGLVPPGEAAPEPPSGWQGEARVAEEGPGWLEQVARLAEGADVLVAAGPHNAGRAACLVAGERPVWADLPGDPFAEVQAVAIATGRPAPERQAGAQAAATAVLARADRLGAVSGRQRLLLLGQLGLVGRLAAPPTSGPWDPVDLAPVAWHFDLPPSPPPARPADSPLRLALVGGANTWLDVDATLLALEEARARQPDLEVLLTGGPLPGHHEAGWQRLQSWAQAHSWAHAAPRLPPDALRRELSRCHVGLVLDREGLEPETGSRTRVLFLLHQGLEVVTTTSTELCAGLAARGLVHPVPRGDPAAVAQALAQIRADRAGQRPRRAAVELGAELDPSVCLAPVVRFCQQPRRGPPPAAPWEALARQDAGLRDELARIHATPTWRALARLHRTLGRWRRGPA